VEDIMMEVMVSNRSLQMDSLWPLLVMDDKGGEGVEIKASVLFPNPAVPDLGVECHMPCNKFVLARVDLTTICNVCYCVVNLV
jgi:hypothetical protein